MARKPKASDFKAHEETYAAFMTVTKWSIISMILAVLALYAFIIVGQPWIGAVLLLMIPIAIIYRFIVGTRA